VETHPVRLLLLPCIATASCQLQGRCQLIQLANTGGRLATYCTTIVDSTLRLMHDYGRYSRHWASICNKYTEHTERPVSAGLSLSLHTAVVFCYPFYTLLAWGWCCVLCLVISVHHYTTSIHSFRVSLHAVLWQIILSIIPSHSLSLTEQNNLKHFCCFSSVIALPHLKKNLLSRYSWKLYH
jgi:hypothetical protein